MDVVLGEEWAGPNRWLRRTAGSRASSRWLDGVAGDRSRGGRRAFLFGHRGQRMATGRELKHATAALEAWYFAANMSEDGKPWHAEPYPGPYRVFAIVASDTRDDGECLGVAYFTGPSDPVVIADRPVPAAVLAAATRLPFGLGCYLGPSGELCNGLGRPALVPAGSEVCSFCEGNRCVLEQAVGSGEGRKSFCERCGGLGWTWPAEPVAAPDPAA